MDDKIKKLSDWGCDIEDALTRFLNKEALYVSFLSRISKEELFEKLGREIENGDIKNSFESAHALKGVLGNMGLTPMYRIVTLMTEILRQGSLENVPLYYEQLMLEKKHYDEIVE